MNTRLFALSLLSLALGCASANAQPTYQPLAPADYKVPAADLENWAARLKKFCPSDNWKVSCEGNDVLLERFAPLGPLVKDKPQFLFLYRFRLRFSPLLSQDKFEQMVEENRVAERNDLFLRYEHKLFQADGILSGSGSEAEVEERKRAYFAESKKLAGYVVPDFYTPDYSVTMYHSWRFYMFIIRLKPELAEFEAECKGVENSVARYLGRYSFDNAANRDSFTIREEEVK